MIAKIKYLFNNHPLPFILILASFVRLVSVILSKGYGMHDDHFGPIELPYQILNNPAILTNWINPSGQSLLYPSIHYYLLKLLFGIGINDTQSVMMIIRLLHGAALVFIVFFGYKIAQILSGEKAAKLSGLLLAILWFMPFFSVRNLIEFISIPPLLAGIYYIIKDKNRISSFASGLFFGLAFTFRFQTLIFPSMIFLVLLFQKEFRQSMFLTIGLILSIFITSGIPDYLVWGKPLIAFITYFFYNSSHPYDYTTGAWYNYILLIIGVLIPPISFILGYSFFRTWKKYAILFVPSLVFILFHSYFPNKQERFILPVIPIYVILSVIGYYEYFVKTAFFEKRKSLVRNSWIFFWVFNTILLIPFTTHYSKKTRVESAYFLGNVNAKNAIVSGGRIGSIMLPAFYTGKYPFDVMEVTKEEPILNLKEKLEKTKVIPDYAVLFGEEEQADRLKEYQSVLQRKFSLVKTFEPSMIDYVLFKMNPRGNRNQKSFIYKIN